MFYKKIKFAVSCDVKDCSRFMGYFDDKKEAKDAAVRAGWKITTKGCLCPTHEMVKSMGLQLQECDKP